MKVKVKIEIKKNGDQQKLADNLQMCTSKYQPHATDS